MASKVISAGCRPSCAASAGYVKAVESRRGATEQVGFLGVACALGEKLAGVPEHRIAVGALIDGKVALEHASWWPECIDAGLDVGPPRACQRLRRWRLGLLVEAEAAHAHAEAAEFDVNIRASGERLDRCGPAGKYLLVLAGIGADSNRAADVIEDDLRFRKSAREIAHLVDLGMVEPGVEGEAETAENGEPFAKVFVAQETAQRAVGRIADRRVGVPGTDVADAAEAVAAGANVRGEHRLDSAAQRQVGVADNAGAMPGLAVDAAHAHGRDAVYELGFAHGGHFDPACGARHPPPPPQTGGRGL